MPKDLQTRPAAITDDALRAMGTAFWNLMEHWQTSRKEQALLLGVKYHPTKLKAWQEEMSIPDDPDKLARVGHLLGIHKNLRILFPYNRRAVYDFMRTPQSFLLHSKAPIELIQEGGAMNSYRNIAAIRRRLDQLRT